MNHSQDSSKRVRIFRKIIALALLILSLYCFLGVWIPLIKGYFKEGFEPFDIIFLFIFPIPFSVFASYCLVVARRLYKGLTKESLRNVCFISSLIVYGISSSIVVSVLGIERSSPKWDMWFAFSEILCMIPAGLFYWLTNKYLMRWLGFDISIDWQRREQAAKNFFGLMAIFVFSFFMFFAHSLEKASDIESSLWIFAPLLLPIILAFTFYKLSVRIVMHGRPKKQSQTSEVVEANLPIE